MLDQSQILALTNQVVGNGHTNLLCCAADGRVRFATDAACTRLGYSMDDMLSKRVYDYTPRVNERAYHDHFNRAVATGSDRRYGYHRDCRGTVFPVEVFSIPHTVEGTQEQLICSIIQEARDCSRYQRMLDTVENSQRIGSFDFRLGDQSILVSDNLLAIMGTEDPEELRPTGIIDRLTQEDASRWNQQMLGFISGYHRMDEEFMVRTAGNRYSLLRAVMWSIQEDDRVTGIVGYYEVLDEPRNEEFISLNEAQRRHIIRALSYTNGRVTGPNGAGRLLDINGKTLFARMKKLGINREDYTRRR